MSNWFRLLYYIIKSRFMLKKSKKEIEEHINKKLFDKNKINPLKINNIQDLEKFPIIDKNMLKANKLSEIISRPYFHEKLNVIETGGSTGEPFSTYLSDEEKEWRLAIQLRAYLNVGHKFYNKWASLENNETFEKQRQSTVFFPHISVPLLWDTNSKINAIKSFNPNVIDGLSSSIWSLARSVNENGAEGISPKLVFGTGELFSPSGRNDVERIFNTSYFDQLSCTEVGHTAWECKEKIGYYINMDSTIVQFLDEKGEEVSPGERGELVYTSLHNFAMPIIRYNIHDIGIHIDDECSCGIKLPLMKMIEGSHNSFISLPSGLIISPWEFIECLKLYLLTDTVNRYKVIQQARDLIEIQIVKTNEDVDEEKIRKWIINNLNKGLKENISPSNSI